ncbi:hypothetical protein F0562_030475 [Nyssa sinensis]|uniref:Uncharacterized protein n=1 Tax=Nyssa sinensis TaxID=561372 RepID=A0A5J5B0N4_9ASTE|nr:hypothetical protein F0562_030475 [Nyssa sinensis]
MGPSSAALPIINGGLFFAKPRSSFSNHHSAVVFRWGMRRDQDSGLLIRRKEGQAFRVLSNPNRKRQIEAINGAWAMLGLTAGLLIEGQTGKNILSQLVGYWAAIVGLFVR